MLCPIESEKIEVMESILSLFMGHDTSVIIFLVAGIMVLLLLILAFNFKNPKSIIMEEVGATDGVEEALRRVLGEHNLKMAGGAIKGGGDNSKLEQELLEKDKEIANLHKQLTQGGVATGGGNDDELLGKIQDLEDRLKEYEIIEDDIADLSLYKNENEKMKAELEELKKSQGGFSPTQQNKEEPPSPEKTEVSDTIVVEGGSGTGGDDQAKTIVTGQNEHESGVMDTVYVAGEESSDQGPDKIVVEEPKKEDEGADSQWVSGTQKEPEEKDLVAEFEKVVSSQEALENVEEPIKVKGEEAEEDLGFVGVIDNHPQLKNVKPNSKEEAEVFVEELKTLKKGS